MWADDVKATSAAQSLEVRARSHSDMAQDAGAPSLRSQRQNAGETETGSASPYETLISAKAYTEAISTRS